MFDAKQLSRGNRTIPRRQSPQVESGDLHTNNAATLHETGLPFVTQVPWGAHVSFFYETKQDLMDTTVRFFEEGLKNNEFCIWAISSPITKKDAELHLRRATPRFDAQRAAGQIEIVHGYDWYLKGNQVDLKRIIDGWSEKLGNALANGYEGIRASGNAFWAGTHRWNEFCGYEQELDRFIAGRKMLVLCAYPIHASTAVDILDVARVHQFSMARRGGHWEFLETPELKQAKREIQKLNSALDILSKPSPGQRSLTPRELLVLAQIVRGASSKEAARTLSVGPRTIEFHRANIMRKLGAKNTVDLVRRVLGEASDAA
jgi:DNA-binding CsgD family transcriptional regulator